MFKEQITALLVVTVICFSFIGCEEAQRENKARALLKNCETLQIGMSKQEVIKIMGKPILTRPLEKAGPPKEVLVFLSPRAASEQTRCVIDVKSGLVEEIECGEGYRLTK